MADNSNDLIITLEELEEGEGDFPYQALGMIIFDRSLNIPAVIRILT